MKIITKFLRIILLSAGLTFIIVSLLKGDELAGAGDFRYMPMITAKVFSGLAVFLALSTFTMFANLWKPIRERVLWRLASFFSPPYFGDNNRMQGDCASGFPQRYCLHNGYDTAILLGLNF